MENEASRLEDDRFHIPKQIPSYLRIDVDVKNGLINLQKLIKEYAQFDIVQLDREQMRKLEVSLDKQSAEYKEHRSAVLDRLTKAADDLEDCIKLKGQIVESRL